MGKTKLSWSFLLALASTACLARGASIRERDARRLSGGKSAQVRETADKSWSSPCTEASQPFQSSLLVTHTFATEGVGNNDWELMDSELAFLEDLLVHTYNKQAAGSYCDPSYRRLSSADTVRYTHEELRILQDDSSGQNVTTVEVQYNLQGSCDGCEKMDDTFFASSSDIAATAAAVKDTPAQHSLLRSGLQRILGGQEQLSPSSSSSSLSSPRLRSGDPAATFHSDCQCDPSQAKRAIKEEELVEAMNEAMLQQRLEVETTVPSRLRSVQSVVTAPRSPGHRQLQEDDDATRQQPLIEVDQYDCSAPLKNFSTTVYLRVSASVESLALLEESFQSAYNNLTFALCDAKFFRHIVSVTADVDQDGSIPAQDALDAVWDMTKASDSPQNTSLIVLQVETECQNCNASTPLFHPVPYLDIMNEQEEVGSTPGANFGGMSIPVGGGVANTRSSSCVCPKNDTNVFRAPTAEEFLMHFNEYHAEDEPVLQVDEDQRMDCSAAVKEESTFFSYSYVGLDVQLQRTTEDDKAMLERVFLETYNQLSYMHCDEYHRSVTNVMLLEDASSPAVVDQILQTAEVGKSLSGEMDATSLHMQRTVFFRIEGRCHDCPVVDGQNYTLFSDPIVGQRKLTTSSSWLMPERRIQMSLDDLCLCAPGVEPGRIGPPSEEDFQVAFSENIDKLLSFGSAEHVVEGWEVPCSPEVSVFTSAVLANVDLDIDSLTEEETFVLEEAFKDVYNSMAYLGCDGHFRRVLNVTVETPFNDNDRNTTTSLTLTTTTTSLHTSLTLTSNAADSVNASGVDAAAPSPAVFTVTSRCRDCNVSDVGLSTLFDAGSLDRVLSGRRLSTSSALPERLLQDEFEKCLCPLGSHPGEDQGPVLEYFQEELNRRVVELKSQGILHSVSHGVNTTANISDPLSSLVEVHPVSCSSNLTKFQSAVYTGLRVNELELQREEVMRIENGFKSLYNNFSFTGCDGYFRSIERVDMVVGNILGTTGRRLQDAELTNETSFFNTTNGAATNDTLFEPTMFIVTGECRDCPVTSSGSFNLFDETFRRALSEATLEVPEAEILGRGLFAMPEVLGRNLFETPDDVCYCPAGRMPMQGPSSAAFSPRFNGIIMDATVDTGMEVKLGGEGQRIAEVDISCAQLELEIVEGFYTVAIPNDVLSLEPIQRANFINMAFPEAYNLFRDGDCAPVVLEANILDKRRLLEADEIQDRTVRVLTIQPTSEVELFRNEDHEIEVAERIQEIFLASEFSRATPFEAATEAPSEFPTPPPTSSPIEPTPPPTPLPSPRPTARPTGRPTPQPTRDPTPGPTLSTPGPTLPSTSAPATSLPTPSPTSSPTKVPTPGPSDTPVTMSPTKTPTPDPTKTPTPDPTKTPTPDPTKSPTKAPTPDPTMPPTPDPTNNPTLQPFAVVRFDLIDCGSSGVVAGNLPSGVVLDRANLPQDLSIEAVTEPGEISAVLFYLDGKIVITEKKVPYSLASNRGDGSFRPSDRLEADGATHTLKAVPVWWYGFEGESLEITFTVIDSNA